MLGERWYTTYVLGEGIIRRLEVQDPLLGYGVDAPGYKDCIAEARKCGESFLRDFLVSVMREINEANMEELLGIYVESDPLRKVLKLAAMEGK